MPRTCVRRSRRGAADNRKIGRHPVECIVLGVTSMTGSKSAWLRHGQHHRLLSIWKSPCHSELILLLLCLLSRSGVGKRDSSHGRNRRGRSHDRSTTRLLVKNDRDRRHRGCQLQILHSSKPTPTTILSILQRPLNLIQIRSISRSLTLIASIHPTDRLSLHQSPVAEWPQYDVYDHVREIEKEEDEKEE